MLGHRGGAGFPRLPLGSVSLHVATHAECPVLTVHGHPRPVVKRLQTLSHRAGSSRASLV
nr:universal stress protein [Streptomyces sp. TRM70350]